MSTGSDAVDGCYTTEVARHYEAPGLSWSKHHTRRSKGKSAHCSTFVTYVVDSIAEVVVAATCHALFLFTVVCEMSQA